MECCIAFTCLYAETLKSLFWIGANYHHPADLTGTSGLGWREAVIRCLESSISPIQDTARPRAQATYTLDRGEFVSAPRRQRAIARRDE